MCSLFSSKKSAVWFAILVFCFVLMPAVLAQGQTEGQGGPFPGGPPMFDGPGMPQGPLGRGPMGRPEFGMPGGPMSELLRRPDIQKEIDITDEQRKKLEDLAFNSAKTAIQAQANLQVHRMELERMVHSDNPDRSAIDKKIQEISQVQTALMRGMINTSLEERSILTKEQRDKMREVLQRQMGERMQRMRMERRTPAWRGRREGSAPPPPPPPRPPLQ